MDNEKTLNDTELENVTGGNSWEEYWGDDDYSSYLDFYCYDCGHILYRVPTRLGKTCEDGYYFCPQCNRMTEHCWKYVSLR